MNLCYWQIIKLVECTKIKQTATIIGDTIHLGLHKAILHPGLTGLQANKTFHKKDG